MRERDTWWEDAQCRDADPRDFEAKLLPSGRRRQSASRAAERDWAVARQICDACPVREQCFWEALEHPETLVGTYEEMFIAGHTPEEMREARKKWERIKRRKAS